MADNDPRKMLRLYRLKLAACMDEVHTADEATRVQEECDNEVIALIESRERAARIDFIDRLPASNNTCTCTTCKLIRDKYAALSKEAQNDN
jgi:hypothetical protein